MISHIWRDYPYSTIPIWNCARLFTEPDESQVLFYIERFWPFYLSSILRFILLSTLMAVYAADIPVSVVSRYPFLPCPSLLWLFLSFHSWRVSFDSVPFTLFGVFVTCSDSLIYSMGALGVCSIDPAAIWECWTLMYHDWFLYGRQGLFGGYVARMLQEEK